jgi:hypothetical protein
MLTATNRVERLFCPTCGGEGVYDASGEHDWMCPACLEFVAPLRERDLQGDELIRLTLENERLRAVIRQLQPNSPESV